MQSSFWEYHLYSGITAKFCMPWLWWCIKFLHWNGYICHLTALRTLEKQMLGRSKPPINLNFISRGSVGVTNRDSCCVKLTSVPSCVFHILLLNLFYLYAYPYCHLADGWQRNLPLWAIYAHWLYRWEVTGACHQSTKSRIFPVSRKGANSYLLHPLWIQAPIHCSPRPHFLATSAGWPWSAASAGPGCWSCLFPTWADRGNTPGRSLCSHLPHASPEVTPGLNSAGQQPNVVLFCHCMAPVGKLHKVWHVRRARAGAKPLDCYDCTALLA